MKYFNKDDDYIKAECKCGRVLKIPRERVTISKLGYNITPPVNCTCGNIDDRIEVLEQKSAINNNNVPIEQRKNIISRLILIILLLPFLFMLHSCIDIISDSSSDSPIRYEDRTNKQDQDFQKWDAEQQQKKWENEKVNE